MKVINGLHIRALLCALLWSSHLYSQSAQEPLRGVSHSASLTFMKRDYACIDGPIAKIDAKSVTIQPYKEPPITLQRVDLLQISQGDALIFTASSSWANVIGAHVDPREAFVLKMRGGQVIKGRPLTVTSDSITLKHGFIVTKYKKSDVATVDYLRTRPESDGFDYLALEAPALLFFDPEFYFRLVGLEGRIPVRLYDIAIPESTTAPKCLGR